MAGANEPLGQKLSWSSWRVGSSPSLHAASAQSTLQRSNSTSVKILYASEDMGNAELSVKSEEDVNDSAIELFGTKAQCVSAVIGGEAIQLELSNPGDNPLEEDHITKGLCSKLVHCEAGTVLRRTREIALW
jgi:hypothetical protein